MDKYTLADYPLSEKHPEEIHTATGRSISDITMEAIMSGEVSAEDCRISEETLVRHAQIEESRGNMPMAQTLLRSAEMTNIPDARIMEIYNAMRPRASTREDLEAIIEELETRYNAPLNAAFLREAVEVYERRNMFR